MPPGNFKRKWIKLWIDECLTGTIREEITPEERSVWYDFLLLAGRNRPVGCISANESTALSPQRLAAILNIPVSLIAKATKKFEDSGRIEVDLAGIIHITNWEKYQYTDYDRQKPYRQAGSDDDILDANLAAIHRCYEDNIGLLTPILAEQLRDISDTYPGGWFEKAVAIACEKNARNLKYVEGILKRWKVEGVDSGGADKPSGHERIQVYTDD